MKTLSALFAFSLFPMFCLGKSGAPTKGAPPLATVDGQPLTSGHYKVMSTKGNYGHCESDGECEGGRSVQTATERGSAAQDRRSDLLAPRVGRKSIAGKR